MLVDNLIQPSYFGAASALSSYPEYSTDFSDIFDTDLFNSTFAVSSCDIGDETGTIDDLTQMGGFDLQLIDPSLMDSPSDVPSMGFSSPPNDDSSSQMGGIDPQLVDTPSLIDSPSPASIPDDVPQVPEKLTSTIAPVKVGGLGKARKGTVQSGGVVKKTTSRLFLTDSPAGSSEVGDDEDLNEDWRPSAEVLAKMTSKEKRQLRNKISARNFRVRRKEYITTLEGDIAERDRLLDHFRTKLGSQESENLALRQEIVTLKKALLEGRGTPTVQSTPLITANTQKDLPTSPRIGGPRFWGGVGMGGGVTPVHTTLVPDISTIVRNGLQENINPSLNILRDTSAGNGIGSNKAQLGGFDGFADLNPFTMKTLDAYRMHLWGKMAAQQQMHQHNQALQNHQNPSSPLASGLRPHHFLPTSSKPNVPSSGYSTLSALLSGKHNVPYSSTASTSYPTPPASPVLHSKGGPSLPVPTAHSLSSSQKEQQHAMLAAMASQTILRKLGSAFWDAFTGSSSASSSSSPRGDWDADKVRRILEGKAVLRVVDVEPAAVPAAALASVSSTISTPAITPKWAASRSSFSQLRSTATSTSSTSSHVTEDGSRTSCKSAACTSVCEILEESMRSLSMGKKM